MDAMMRKIVAVLALFTMSFNAHGAIAYRTIVVNETPSVTLGINPGATALDVIYLAVVDDSASAITYTYPASFDELAKQTNTFDGAVSAVARKKSASGSEGTINTTDNLGASKIGAMISFSGVDNTTPEDVACNVTNTNTGQTSPWTQDSGSITPTTAGAKIVAFMFSDSQSQPTTHSFSTVSGSTSAWTVHDAQVSDGVGRNFGVASADWTSGSIVVRGTGTAAANQSGRTLVVCVLRPAAAGSSNAPRMHYYRQQAGQ